MVVVPVPRNGRVKPIVPVVKLVMMNHPLRDIAGEFWAFHFRCNPVCGCGCVPFFPVSQVILVLCFVDLHHFESDCRWHSKCNFRASLCPPFLRCPPSNDRLNDPFHPFSIWVISLLRFIAVQKNCTR